MTEEGRRGADRRRSLADLASSLTSDAVGLVGLEFELARAEAASQVKRLIVGIAMFAAAALLAVTAIGALTATAIAAFNLILPLWLAALVVALALVLLALVLVAVGRSQLKAASMTAPKTFIEGVQKDAEAIRDGFSDGQAAEPARPRSGGG